MQGNPDRVAIIGGGPSIMAWFALLAETGKSPSDLFDEVWATGDTFRSIRFDRAIISRQYDRIEATGLANFLSCCGGTVYMPEPRPGWRSQAYPIDLVLNHIGRPYFANDTAYALALAMTLGATRVSLFGCETDDPRERGSLEYLCGLFEGRGGKLSLAPSDLLGLGTRGLMAGYTNGALVCPGGTFRWLWGDTVLAEHLSPTTDLILETSDHAV